MRNTKEKSAGLDLIIECYYFILSLVIRTSHSWELGKCKLD